MSHSRPVAFEELLILLLQFVAELLLEIVAWLPWDLFVWWQDQGRPPSALSGRLARTLVGCALGGLMGLVSLKLVPTAVLTHELSRVLNLVVSPWVCGGVALVLARVRRDRGARVEPAHHAWFAIVFSAAFLLVRFAEAAR